MGNGGTKENQNVYFRARKQAALYNEKLSSLREQQRCSEYPHRPWQITNWE